MTPIWKRRLEVAAALVIGCIFGLLCLLYLAPWLGAAWGAR